MSDARQRRRCVDLTTGHPGKHGDGVVFIGYCESVIADVRYQRWNDLLQREATGEVQMINVFPDDLLEIDEARPDGPW